MVVETTLETGVLASISRISNWQTVILGLFVRREQSLVTEWHAWLV